MKLLSNIQRIVLVNTDRGLVSTDAIFEYFRRIGRSIGDLYELFIWEDLIEVNNSILKLIGAFDPHSIQIPEIVDGIRALTKITNLEDSIKMTNQALKIVPPSSYP